jgi:two-component sensor histidine kinase
MQAAIEGQSQRHEITFRVRSQGDAARWLQDRGASFALAPDPEESPTRIMGTIIDVTEHKEAEHQQELLMAELDHRVKNVLANVAAVLRLSSRRNGSIESFVDALDGRIQAMSRAHGLLREGRWKNARLDELVRGVLDPFQAEGRKNILIEGEALSLTPKLAQTFALLFHELATNAVKYGALSNSDGRVYVEWSPAAGGHGHSLSWRERGGPPVEKSEYKGFGLTMLELAAAEIDATVDISFDRDGLTCEITGPIGQAQSRPRREWTASAVRPAAPTSPLAENRPRRVLVVEDDALVAHQLQLELQSAGYEVMGPAHTLQGGLDLARDCEIDAALVDIRLGEKVSSPIADQLIARSIPFAFSTGYSSGVVLPPHLRSIPTVNKPYRVKDIRRILDQLVPSSGACQPPGGAGKRDMPARTASH